MQRILNKSNSTGSLSDTMPGQKSFPLEQRGFTLLEVMIALAIIATVLVALLGLQSRTIRLADRQQKITKATMLAQERMSELEIKTLSGGDNRDDDGVFEKPFSNFRWKIRYESTPLAAVEMVTVTVSWGELENNENIDVTSFVFR